MFAIKSNANGPIAIRVSDASVSTVRVFVVQVFSWPISIWQEAFYRHTKFQINYDNTWKRHSYSHVTEEETLTFKNVKLVITLHNRYGRDWRTKVFDDLCDWKNIVIFVKKKNIYTPEYTFQNVIIGRGGSCVECGLSSSASGTGHPHHAIDNTRCVISYNALENSSVSQPLRRARAIASLSVWSFPVFAQDVYEKNGCRWSPLKWPISPNHDAWIRYTDPAGSDMLHWLNCGAQRCSCTPRAKCSQNVVRRDLLKLNSNPMMIQ